LKSVLRLIKARVEYAGCIVIVIGVMVCSFLPSFGVERGDFDTKKFVTEILADHDMVPELNKHYVLDMEKKILSVFDVKKEESK
jgi:hypothetical protein